MASGFAVQGRNSRELDITNAARTRDIIASSRPDVVINCAAYTAVDQAESHEDRAWEVNAAGAGNVAAACREAGAHLVHVSTDYVFRGDAEEPYETDAAVGPASAYGRTKLAGEQQVRKCAPDAQIVRTAWVFTGAPGDFVGTMRRLERERANLDVVDDQVGSPTYAADLADALLALATNAAAWSTPVFHLTNAGTATWFQLAQAVFEEIGADPARIRPCRTEDFPRPAPRPRFSVLSGSTWRTAGLPPMRHWRAALHAAIAAHGDEC